MTNSPVHSFFKTKASKLILFVLLFSFPFGLSAKGKTKQNRPKTNVDSLIHWVISRSEKIKSASFSTLRKQKSFDDSLFRTKTSFQSVVRDTNLKAGIRGYQKIGKSQKWADKSWTAFFDPEWKNKVIFDTVYPGSGFTGNSHDAMAIAPWFNQNLLATLKNKTADIKLIPQKNTAFYLLSLSFPDDEETDHWVKNLWVDKKSGLITRVETEVHYKPTDQWEKTKMYYKLVSINDNKALIALKNFSPKRFPAIEYTEKFIEPKKQAPGSSMPYFRLATDQNDTITLESFKGKFVIIDFWYQGCAPCMRAAPYLDSLYLNMKDSLVILGFNPFDPLKDILKVKSLRNLHYPLVLANKQTTVDFGIRLFPTLFILDREGKLIDTELGIQEDLPLWIVGIQDKIRNWKPN